MTQRGHDILPIEGLGATYFIGSDSYPYTVVKVLSSRRIWVQSDLRMYAGKSIFSDSQQEWITTSNPDAIVEEWSLRKNGVWRQKGDGLHDPGRLVLGKRQSYEDPNF